MQYLGGKSKIRKPIAAFLESVRKPNQAYLEPFVGGAWVLQEMSGMRYASDVMECLIVMYRALQEGWEPPDAITEVEYAAISARNNPSDPLTAFVGFGCSFGGKFFGGYARKRKGITSRTDYAGSVKRSLLKQLPLIKDVVFTCQSFETHQPHSMLIYCDPPYAGTSPYRGTVFDRELFWQTMRVWSRSNTVVISEYQAPDDFICVKTFESRMGLTCQGQRSVRTEKIFMYPSESLDNLSAHID